ncbi:MAG: hypothetical protein IPH08_04145 [Rhodocyclaceae bacterium]|nr:hypothetical protein [Rhodocyclaceae bacterium]
MDPNEVLKRIRAIAWGQHRTCQLHHTPTEMVPTLDDYQVLADLACDLDEWMSRGGFLPDAWRDDGGGMSEDEWEVVDVSP